MVKINILDRRHSWVCPECREEFKTVISLIGHSLSKHRVNLLAAEKKRKARGRGRRTSLSYIKLGNQ